VSHSFHQDNVNSHITANDLLTVQSGHIGTTCVVPKELQIANCHAVIITRPIVSKGNSNFIAYYFNSPLGKKRLSSLHVGSTIKHINTKDLRKFDIPLPPLPEQNKIAEILTSVDETIESTRKVIEQTKKVKQGLLQELLTKGIGNPKLKKTEIGIIPEAWTVVKLIDYSSDSKNSFANGPFGSDLLSSELTDNGVPVIYIRDISENNYSWISNMYVTEEKADSLMFCNIFENDVIITKVGDPPAIAALYQDKTRSIMTQDVIRIRPKEDVSPMFLVNLLNSKFAKDEVKRIEIKGTRKRVSLTEYKKIRLPLPTHKEQKIIANILNSFDKQLEATENELIRLEKVKRGLMQDLLTGTVRVKV